MNVSPFIEDTGQSFSLLFVNAVLRWHVAGAGRPQDHFHIVVDVSFS